MHGGGGGLEYLQGFAANSKELRRFAKAYMDLQVRDLQDLQRFGMMDRRICKVLQDVVMICMDLMGFVRFFMFCFDLNCVTYVLQILYSCSCKFDVL